MTTLAPDRAGPAAAGPESRSRALEPARGPGRNAGQQKDDSGTRAWLRRRAVAAWMNVLIAGTAAVTVLTAGIASGRAWPEPGAWGAGAAISNGRARSRSRFIPSSSGMKAWFCMCPGASVPSKS